MVIWRSSVRSSNFYPRSPCGERLAVVLDDGAYMPISIHALLAESDYWAQNAVLAWAEFLSTLSLRRATGFAIINSFISFISIHALLAESDDARKSFASDFSHFYPRSPCGERRQSVPRSHPAAPISIHALLAESDPLSSAMSC